MGRVKSSSQTVGSGAQQSFTYGYDLSGALAYTIYPSGRTVANTFDAGGRICAVDGATNSNCTTSGSQYVWNVGYAPQGAISGLTFKNGVSETWGFNTRQQPQSLQVSKGAASLLNLGWDYGPVTTNNGNVMSHTITPGTSTLIQQAYQYDAFNRLTLAVENPQSTSNPACWSGETWCEGYSYDAFGNRVESNEHLGSFTAPGSFDSNNRNAPNTSCQQGDPGSGWRYDCAGNLTRDAGNATYTYDGENRQVAACANVSNPASCSATWSAGNVTYAYDGQGRRVQAKHGDGTVTMYVYDAAGNLAAEYGASTASGAQYLTVDSLGSTRLVTSDTGVPTSRMDYLPFGVQITSSLGGRQSVMDGGQATYVGDQGVRQKFTGKERDETQLDYFGARYFSSAQGRFTSPDWSARPQPVPYVKLDDPQSLNLYVYVRNNPLCINDPDGHGWWEDLKKRAAALTGTASQLLNDGLRRVGYDNAAKGLTGPGASAERKVLQAATYTKLTSLGQAYTDAAKAARVGQLANKSPEALIESASRTNTGVNTAGKVSAGIGAVGLAVGVGSVVVETANAPEGTKTETAVKASSRLAGSLAGAELGAMAGGSVGGFWGALAGSIVGSIGGTEAVRAFQKPMSEDERIGMGVVFH
jgi:RHS repeat-associated protein